MAKLPKSSHCPFSSGFVDADMLDVIVVAIEKADETVEVGDGRMLLMVESSVGVAFWREERVGARPGGGSICSSHAWFDIDDSLRDEVMFVS
jgi:hypothetical protein